MSNPLSPSPTNPLLDPALHEDDRSDHLIGACTAFIILPTLFVALRLTSRWVSRAGLWWDDLTIIVALMFS